jgi:hypothetical protein
MMDFTNMTDDELHTLLETREALWYELQKENRHPYWLTGELNEISEELRDRGVLWTKLDSDDLIKRYRMGMAVAPIDSIMDEWQHEIERRDLPVPTEAWVNTYEAYEWWWTFD